MILLIYLLLSLSLLTISFFLNQTIKKLPTEYPQHKPFTKLKNFFLIIGSCNLVGLIGSLIKISFFLSPLIPLFLIIILLLGSMILGFSLAKTFQ